MRRTAELFFMNESGERSRAITFFEGGYPGSKTTRAAVDGTVKQADVKAVMTALFELARSGAIPD